MEKKKMTFWQIFNMSFGFLGIQFGLALQNANVSRCQCEPYPAVFRR